MNREREEEHREDTLPELPLKPLVDVLQRIVQNPPWLKELATGQGDEAKVIERWVYEEMDSLLGWLRLVEEASQAIQAVARFKATNLPQNGNRKPSVQ